jgi:signal transduction histidine kinase
LQQSVLTPALLASILMVSTTHPDNTASVGAHRPRKGVTLWRGSSPRRPADPQLRPRGYVQAVVRVALVAGCALAAAAAVITTVADGAARDRAAVHAVPILACLGLGIAAGFRRSPPLLWVADAAVLGGAGIALFELVAALFGFDPVSITIAASGLLFAAVIVLRRRDHGLGKLFDSPSGGGVLARRLVPVVLIVPVGIAWSIYAGIAAGRYDGAVATALGVTVGVAMLTSAIVFSARVADQLDIVRHGNDAQFRELVGDVARQSRELARTNEELESFSYSVSHDLRAPIRHIAGFSELLANHGGHRLDDKGQRYLTMIAESAEQAGQLIDDLLAFSRIGRTALATREVDPAEIVHDAWTKLAPEREGRAVELRVAALPPVHADPAMLQIVMTNLLSNALKYSGCQAVAVIEVAGRAEPDEVVISVRDNGVGFDMKYVDKLFGVFQRLHGDEFEGVGIGLANVKRIIERHGGRVWAEGEVDRGACFHITLPPAKKANT